MRYSDPFPIDMSAGELIRWLDETTRRPDVTPKKLAEESSRLGIATEEGARALVDRLVAWKNRKD